MPVIQVNGKSFQYKVSQYHARYDLDYYRRQLYAAFASMGIQRDYIELDPWSGGNANISVTVRWHVNGQNLEYTCSSQTTRAGNLASIVQVLEMESKALRRGLKNFQQVMNQFRLDYQPENAGQRYRSPREILGIAADMKDWEYIEWTFRKLVKANHPDAGGKEERMAEINKAFDDLKKEMGK
jgi:hypothetical protein